MTIIQIYLLTINSIAGILFAIDKRLAMKGGRRIPERTLHLLELLGGVFTIWLLTYIIRHKNRKSSYFAITYLILIGWAILLFYFNKS